MAYAIQFVDTARDEHEAREMLSACAIQVDYLGGRVLPATNAIGKTEWRVQAFFEDAPDATWLPDGCRRVLLMGIRL